MKLVTLLFVAVACFRGTRAAIKEPGWKHCIFPLHALPNKWQTLTSPGYPNGISTQIQCSWMISSNPGFRIKLAFHTLNMTGSRGSCFTQFVEVQDYKIGHSAGKFCGASRPGDYVSWGTRLRFDLQGDTAGAGTKGFDIRYKATKEPGGFKSTWAFPNTPKTPKRPPKGRPKTKPKQSKPAGNSKSRRPSASPPRPGGARPGGARPGGARPGGARPGGPRRTPPPAVIPPPGEDSAKPSVTGKPAVILPKTARPLPPRTATPVNRIDFRQPVTRRPGPIIYGANSNVRGVDHGQSRVITMTEEEEPVNIYVIVGVAAGGAVALTIIFILMKVCIFDKNKKRRKRRKEQEQRAKSPPVDPAENFQMSVMPGMVPEQYMAEQIVPQQMPPYHRMQSLPVIPQTMSRHMSVMHPQSLRSGRSKTVPRGKASGAKSSRSRARSSRSRARSSRSREARNGRMYRSRSRSSMRNSASKSALNRSRSKSLHSLPPQIEGGWVMVDPRHQVTGVVNRSYPRGGDDESSDMSSTSDWDSDSTDSFRQRAKPRSRRHRSLPRVGSRPPPYDAAMTVPYYVIDKSRDFDEGYDTGRRTNATKSTASKRKRDRKRDKKSQKGSRRRKYSH